MNRASCRLIMIAAVASAFCMGACNSLSGVEKISIDKDAGKKKSNSSAETTGMGGMSSGGGGMGGAMGGANGMGAQAGN